MSAPGLPDIYLHPGDHYFGSGDLRILTVLGSCVSLALWHPRKRIGGMCHYMLPTRGARQEPPSGRYADEAWDLLLAGVGKAGTRVQDYVITMVGGADMFPGLKSRSHLDVGARNIEAGRRLLEQHGLRAEASHLGGVGHWRVCFDLSSGRLEIIQFNSAECSRLTSQDRI